MSDTQKDSDEEIGRQAAEWFVRLSSPDFTLAERREYLSWLKQSQSHVHAMLSLETLSRRLKRLKLGETFPEEAASNELLPRDEERAPVAEVAQQVKPDQ